VVDFVELFEAAKLNPDITYLFELTSFENRIITHYEGTKLWFLGAIERNTGNDVSTCDMTRLQVAEIGCEFIGQRSFKTIADCLKAVAALPDLDEGYVLHDQKSNIRIEVKSPKYVALHHRFNGGLNPKQIKELVLTNEVDEYLNYFPDDKEHFEHTRNMLAKLEGDICTAFNMHSHHVSQRDYALAIKDLCISTVLFKARAKDKRPLDVWNELD